MRFVSITLLSVLAIGSTNLALAASHKHAKSAIRASHSTVRHASVARPHIFGQRSIDDQRATEIQTALIKAGYLTGEPSGHWDADSQAAMEKLQADNGWQTKLVPDSRALIKLGLGPNSTPAVTESAESSGTQSFGAPPNALGSSVATLTTDSNQ